MYLSIHLEPSMLKRLEGAIPFPYCPPLDVHDIPAARAPLVVEFLHLLRDALLGRADLGRKPGPELLGEALCHTQIVTCAGRGPGGSAQRRRRCQIR